MAGSYTDYPANRMALQSDGSTAFRLDYNGDLDAVSAANLNDESPSTRIAFTADGDNAAGDAYLGYVFPEARDVEAYFIAVANTENSVPLVNAGRTVTVEWSDDTTNGMDGSWTSLGNAALPGMGGDAGDPGTVKPYYRTVTAVGPLSAATGIRIRVHAPSTGSTERLESGHFLTAFHVFGSPSAVGDRLRLWHPTNDEPVGPAHFDWGNVPQDSTDDITFRVKNESETLTATTITISVDAPTDASPSVATQHTIDDGGGFDTTGTIASLAPEAISSVITLRRTTPSNAATGVWTFRVIAAAASWS